MTSHAYTAAPALDAPVALPAKPGTAAPTATRASRTALVIGAGIGGLATAVRLGHAGYRVTLIEKADRPGGRAGRFEQDGFTFDTGPSLVMMPEYWHKLFNGVGRRVEDYLDLVPVEPLYDIYWPDGTVMRKSSVLHQFLVECEKIEPGVTPRMMEFLARTGELYHGGLEFIGRNLHTPGKMLDLGAAKSLLTTGALGDLQKLARKFLKNPKVRDAMTFQTLYLGLSPYDAMAIYGLLGYTEMAHGIHYPMGGMHELPLALVRLGREFGVDYQFGVNVARLEKEGDRVKAAVAADGRRFEADLVCVNADLPYAYDKLLGEPYPGIEQKKFSCSVVLLYLGCNREFPQIPHHTFFVSDDLDASCTRLFEHHEMPDEMPIYLVATSRTDRSQAPPGCENLFVLTLAPSHHPDPARRIDWSVKGPEVEDALIDRLERMALPELRDSIVVKRMVTPQDFTLNYGNLRGEAFGLAHNFTQIGYFRPHNRHATYRNLFFAGQSTHPGCGLPMGLISAECVVERIAEEMPVR